MKKRTFLQLTCALALASVYSIPHAAKTITVDQHDSVIFAGKNDEWLFASWEIPNDAVADAANAKVAADLLSQAVRLFEARGIATAMVLVPSKNRVYEDLLPPPADPALGAYFRGRYDSAIKALREGGVNVVDLNTPFVASPNRLSDTPLYLRQDMHWSPTGAMFAAELVRASIDANPKLKAVWAATPEVKCTLEQHKKKTISKQRNLVKKLPPGSGEFELERELGFDVTCPASQATLTGAGDVVEIALVGSSFTYPAYGFQDALRYTLQRNFLAVSKPEQGPWAGMLEYLNSEAFKKNPPKLIVWEVSEVTLGNPPDSPWRDPRYQMSGDEWLARMKTMLQQ